LNSTDTNEELEMCGIVGAWRAEANILSRIETASALLRHRGPDGYGRLDVENCKSAHLRLSIVDVAGGAQPLFSEDFQTALLYNGEIYNHRALCGELKKSHTFATASDGEPLLHLYEDIGPQAISRLRGMFAIAIWQPKRLLLARDPIGIKPLYWARDGATIYFGSELKAVQKLCAPALIEEFPPGHYFTSDEGLVQFWELEQAVSATRRSLNEIPELAWEELLLDQLKSAVTMRLMADVPLGVFLSGGLDSSLVAALMRPQIDELHSFAAGTPGCSDLAHAATVARELKTTHHEIHIDAKAIESELENIVYHLESFDADLIQSAVPCYFVSREAAKYVKVVLTGEGADELFAGYSYHAGYDHNNLNAELLRSVRRLHNINLQRVDRMSMAHGLEARVPFLDIDFVATAMCVPPRLKTNPEAQKYILRKAAARVLPSEIAWRKKEQFDEGSGSVQALAKVVGDKDQSRETYRRLFSAHYPAALSGMVAQWSAGRISPGAH
jgi:asparagine synthase (glutamine-hydrolysing)